MCSDSEFGYCCVSFVSVLNAKCYEEFSSSCSGSSSLFAGVDWGVCPPVGSGEFSNCLAGICPNTCFHACHTCLLSGISFTSFSSNPSPVTCLFFFVFFFFVFVVTITIVLVVAVARTDIAAISIN